MLKLIFMLITLLGGTCVALAEDYHAEYNNGVNAMSQKEYDKATIHLYMARNKLAQRKGNEKDQEILRDISERMFLLSLALQACKGSNSAIGEIPLEDQYSLYVSIFANELKRFDRDELARQAGVKKHRVFLAIYDQDGKTDPPQEVMSKLSHLDISMHLYSDAEIPDGDNPVQHKDGREGDELISIRLIGWVRENNVIVGVYNYHGPLAGSGHFAVYVKNGEEWQQVEELIRWVS